MDNGQNLLSLCILRYLVITCSVDVILQQLHKFSCNKFFYFFIPVFGLTDVFIFIFVCVSQWFEDKFQEVDMEEQQLRKLHAVVDCLVSHRKGEICAGWIVFSFWRRT